MTANGKTFNYSFCDTLVLGNYIYDYYDVINDEPYVNDFDVTYNGEEISTQSISVYLYSIIILFVLSFILFFIGIKLPNDNNRDSEGQIISINQLKYLRPVLFVFSWGLILGIIFIVTNMAIAYIPNQMVGSFLFTIFQIIFWMTIIALPIWLIWIFVKIAQDKEMKQMIERGIGFNKL